MVNVQLSLTTFRTKKVFSFILSLLLVLVPFFAFISVWTTSLIGHFTVVRLWDNVLLLIIVACSLAELFKSDKLRKLLFHDKLNWLIFCYALLTVLLGIISYFNHDVSLKALFYGLLVNLRYLLLFVAVRLLAGSVKFKESSLIKILFWPLLLVSLFAVLQFVALPHNFLSHFGYGANTYPQYITINQNNNTIRVQSFLRGPNPLGAYLAVTICILFVYLIKSRRKVYLWLLLALSLTALYLSFSRGALIGALIGLVVIWFLSLKKSKSRVIYGSIVILAVILLSLGYVALRNNHGVEDLLFHHSNYSTAQTTSNEAHFEAFKNNIKIAAKEPLGYGLGTSGQASWYNNGHVKNPEDYFIQISEEVGWLGLAIFLSILILCFYKLWQDRYNFLSLGLMGGLIAVVIISLFSYSWSDDTLAYLWWGLAGLALPQIKNNKA